MDPLYPTYDKNIGRKKSRKIEKDIGSSSIRGQTPEIRGQWSHTPRNFNRPIPRAPPRTRDVPPGERRNPASKLMRQLQPSFPSPALGLRSECRDPKTPYGGATSAERFSVLSFRIPNSETFHDSLPAAPGDPGVLILFRDGRVVSEKGFSHSLSAASPRTMTEL